MTVKRGQRGGILARALIVLLILGLIGAGIVGYGAYELKKRLTAEGPLEETQILWVQRGDTVNDIAERLSTEGAVATG